MGADLFESYCGSILAACALGAAAYVADPAMQMKAAVAPLAIAGLGILLSIIGVFLVKTASEGADQRSCSARCPRASTSARPDRRRLGRPALAARHREPLGHLGRGGDRPGHRHRHRPLHRVLHLARLPPTKSIARAAEGGPATVIIAGIGVGMLSTVIPVLAVVAGTMLAFLFASGFDSTQMAMGLYGVAIAAVGMLSTLGITLASDAYGPIADNAGGNAEMSGLGPGGARAHRRAGLARQHHRRHRQGLRHRLRGADRAGPDRLLHRGHPHRADQGRHRPCWLGRRPRASHRHATLLDFMAYYNVTLLNPVVLIALFLGAMVAFAFSGLTVQAVGRAAQLMVEEVRRQFREDPGILKGTSEPDYERCVEISTVGAQREMILPSLIAIAAPVLVGLLFGVAGVIGLLVGGLATGFALAVFLSNAGGAWDNAKKYIESGHHGGKNSAAHRASVIGDTIGDPVQGHLGPSLNILIKLMSIVAIVMAGVTVSSRCHRSYSLPRWPRRTPPRRPWPNISSASRWSSRPRTCW
jgi:K(+)-stimulated pyrophosphate-energized sodium pump